jgi:hypothetical protein
VGHVVDQPFDGVPGVAALIDVGVRLLGRIVGPHVDELAIAQDELVQWNPLDP